jgi:uncharacterized tellurite resistance protein B-like protein
MKPKKKSPVRLDKGAALTVIALAATRADDSLHPEELALLRMFLYQNRMYRRVEDVDRYIERWADFLQETGSAEAVAQAAAALPPRLRETAYAVAVEIVYSDHKQKQPEHSFLQALRAQLGINGQLAGKIQAVSAIRMRDS